MTDYNYNQDTGDWSEWNTHPATTVDITAAAGLNGSAYGIGAATQSGLPSSTQMANTLAVVSTSSYLRWGFYFNKNTAVAGAGGAEVASITPSIGGVSFAFVKLLSTGELQFTLYDGFYYTLSTGALATGDLFIELQVDFDATGTNTTATLQVNGLTVATQPGMTNINVANNELILYQPRSEDMSGIYYIDEFTIRVDNSTPIYSPVAGSQRLLDLAAPLMGGSYFWTTVLEGGTLKVQKRDMTIAVVKQYAAFGAASNSDIDARTYELHVTDYDNSIIFAFGRYNHATYGITHVMRSLDGGVTWSVVTGTDWAADMCATLCVDVDGVGYAIRTSTTAAPKLYKITSVAKYVVTLPLPAGTTISHKTAVLGYDGVMYVAGIKVDGTVVVLKSDSAKLSWQDITHNLSITNITSLVSLE